MHWTLYNIILSVLDLFYRKRKKDLCSLSPIVGKSILVHAVSLGEAKAALELIRRLKKSDPSTSIMCTVWTQTGYDFLKNEAIADHLLYFPIDTMRNMKMLIERVNPELVIFVENDLWPNFLRQLKQKKIKTLLVNGKVSQLSFRRFKRFPRVCPFRYLDFLSVQNSTYKDLFLKLGVSKDRIEVTGNLKFDLPKKKMVPTLLSPQEKRDVISIVSTHPHEEELLLKHFIKSFKGTMLVFLAPRHPNRFVEVENLLKRLNLSYTYYAENVKSEKIDVVLVNKLGVLESIYPLSSVTIVGGSFCEGYPGHNVYEPLQYGSQVIFGPYMHKQEELEFLLSKTQISRQVNGDRLCDILRAALKQEFCKRSYEELSLTIGGALNKTERIIKDLVEN